jgi:ribosomal protein L35
MLKIINTYNVSIIFWKNYKKGYFCPPKLETMPKVKTHSRAKKTFKVTASGKIRRYKAFKSHLLTKKSKTRKRHLRQAAFVHPTNENLVKRMLGLR